jgi:hypothetical protein
MDGKGLQCFIWWGAPKLYQPRKGPERGFVGQYAKFGMLVLTLFPVYWLWQEKAFLLVYALGIVGLVMSIGINECSRCLNFDCGHCGVPEDIRKEYLETIESHA